METIGEWMPGEKTNKYLLQGLWCKKYALELILSSMDSTSAIEKCMRESARMYEKARRALLAALDNCSTDEAIEVLAELGDLYSVERLESYSLRRALLCYCCSYSLSKKQERQLGVQANTLYYYNLIYNLKEQCEAAVSDEEFESWINYFRHDNNTLSSLKAYLE